MQPPSLGVLLQPGPQTWPLAQQRLVGDLGLAFADRDEAIAGEGGQDRAVAQLCERHARAHVAVAGEPQQDAARLGAAVVVEPPVGGLGQARHRAAYAARALVRLQRQPLVPELEQRGREQRERTRLLLDVGDQGVGEPGLDR